MSKKLRDACRAGDAQRVVELVAAGHSPDEPLDAIGTTPLMAASTPEVVGALLNVGASVAPTRFGRDALQVVASDEESALEHSDQRLEAARMLIRYGAPLDRRNEHGWSRLYTAAFAGDVGAVETLLALGADPNDEPPPLAAASWGTGDDLAATSDIVNVLVAAGADIHRCDNVGWSLLHAAAMPYSHGDGYSSSDGPNLAAMQALIGHGMTADVSGPDGTTPLMLVAGDGAIDAVEGLLTLGSDPSVRDDAGDRAYDHARNSERRLTELLATASLETTDAVREARDRARRCAERLAAFEGRSPPRGS